VGAQLAAILNRETFNLYTSLGRRNIGVKHVDARLLRRLIYEDVVYPGSSSASLVRVDRVSRFVDREISKMEQRMKKRENGRTMRDRTEERNRIQENL
jgi:hypothetical protein